MKKVLCTLLALLTMSSSAFADGLKPHALSYELRGQLIEVPLVGASTTSATLNTNGVIFKSSMMINPTSTAIAVSHITATSTIGPLVWPAKLDVRVLDSGAASALECDSIQIIGKDQFGNPKSETITGVTEATKESVNVYSVVTKIIVLGCGGGTDVVGDSFILQQSDEVGLPFKIASESNIEALCVRDKSVAANGAAIVCASGPSAFVADIPKASIELDGISGFPTLETGDTAIVRVRAPGGY